MIYERIQKGRFLNKWKRRNGPCEEHREVRRTSGSGSRGVCSEV